MKDLWEKIKKHPIANKVVAGLILLILTKIFDTIFSLNIFSSITTFISMEFTVPMWGLVLVGIIPIIIILSLSLILRKTVVSTDKEPDWMSYTQDLIFNILWQWKYRWESIESIETDDVIALCPKCMRELDIKKDYNHMYGNRFYMQCFHCDFKSKNMEGDIYNYKKLVIREIQGRLRKGEYKEKIKKPLKIGVG